MGRAASVVVNLTFAGIWAGLWLTLWLTLGWRPGLLTLIAPLLHIAAGPVFHRLHARWTVPEKVEITTPGLRELPLYPRPGLPPADRPPARGMLE